MILPDIGQVKNEKKVEKPCIVCTWRNKSIQVLSLLTGTKLKSLKIVSNVEGNLIIKENWKGKFYRCMKEKRYTDVLFAKLALLKLVNWRGILDHKFVVYHVQEMRELIHTIEKFEQKCQRSKIFVIHYQCPSIPGIFESVKWR